MPPVSTAGTGFSPLDAELGLLPNHRFTPRVEEVVARLGATVPFAEAAALLRDVLGVRVSEATVRRVSYAAGVATVAVEAAEVTAIERDLPPVPVQPERMQLSVDATKVPLVGGAWTDAKLAVFADLVPAVDAQGQPSVEAVNLSYVARWEPADVFARTLTAEAHRRGLEAARELASPNDGALWIQGVLDHVAPQAVRILDEPHAAEHLTTIGALVYGEQTAAATAWTARQRTRLQQDDPAETLAELTHVLARGPHPHAPPGPDGLTPAAYLAREVTYFHERAAQIRYAAFRRDRYPIGSGIAESGHKVVISPRFKRAGQHWAAPHLSPLLAMRATLCNDRWAERWPLLWTQQQETLRTARRRAHDHRRAARATDRPALPAVVAPRPPSPGRGTPRCAPPRAVAPRRPAADHPWRRPFRSPPARRVS